MARPRGQGSTWRRMRAPRRVLQDSLQQRHRLRLHGWCIGSLTLAVMWAVSHAQMLLGVQSLALRYLATLGVGYLAYLLVLRLWAAWLLRPARKDSGTLDGADLLPDVGWPSGRGGGPAAPRSGGGGDYAGGGASGDWGMADGGLGDAASGALEAAGSADEGAVVVVPVVAIFLLGAAVLFGAGALAWAYFGSEVLMAVAVELAFSVAAARAVMGAERAGWLAAAVRLTWKPLLGALLCAVVLGAGLDHFVPEARSLPHAVHLLRDR
ncbi:hypothetical protein [Acidovorax sp. SDU_ACID1]|uniref:hypothetical protein n=1 Tax=Acidovorax sp. SDU_ACID1 TaxID=3136632 RepID=UPI003872D0FC